ncbi:MAG: 3'-5' exonuclease, partial [Acutalibacteraceae bacterium]
VTKSDIEEERRLAYVAITRAKQSLTITDTASRMLYGTTNHNKPSRFVGELPDECIDADKDRMVQQRESYGSFVRRGSRDDISSSSFGGSTNSSASQRFKNMQTRTISQQQKKPTQTFTAGERVRHKAFGDGLVINATKMGNDYMLEIAFDTVGTKKIMANFAGVEKI